MAGTSPATTIWMDHVRTIAIALLVVTAICQAHAQTLPGGFVYLRDIDPTIIQDIRYATLEQFRRPPAPRL